jgi:hypothetical protein
MSTRKSTKKSTKKSAAKSAKKKTPAKRSSKKKTTRRATRTPNDRLHEIALALPEAHVEIAWGEPTFRVRNKIFAMHSSADTHHGRGTESVWVKAISINQSLMVRQRPDRFFVPPYVGPSGWVGVILDGDTDWPLLAELLEDAWRMTAPKRVIAAHDETRR